MFQIISSNTISNNTLEIEPTKINVPCFYLTNGTISNNFTPMFTLNSVDEEILDIDTLNFNTSSIPSLYTMVEIDIDSLEPLEDISTLYLNGSKYQNLLEIDELILYNEPEIIEEREST